MAIYICCLKMGCFKKLVPRFMRFCFARNANAELAFDTDICLPGHTLYFSIPESLAKDFFACEPEDAAIGLREYMFLYKFETKNLVAKPDVSYKFATYYLGDVSMKGWVPDNKKYNVSRKQTGRMQPYIIGDTSSASSSSSSCSNDVVQRSTHQTPKQMSLTCGTPLKLIRAPSLVDISI
ncbi:uncharacterized protein LOC127866171 isoform X2 [Dreissena polymorpha]|uniref:uncharacterized protein LOC127866171 isoform X2 n=1 Tax=Dreissena polymorpha TaxID=45954 RepID=UPI002263E3CF|nr:uncharacterized protein LOC127866171 isoform X2 [Dreissena polymorpha]